MNESSDNNVIFNNTKEEKTSSIFVNSICKRNVHETADKENLNLRENDVQETAEKNESVKIIMQTIKKDDEPDLIISDNIRANHLFTYMIRNDLIYEWILEDRISFSYLFSNPKKRDINVKIILIESNKKRIFWISNVYISIRNDKKIYTLIIFIKKGVKFKKILNVIQKHQIINIHVLFFNFCILRPYKKVYVKLIFINMTSFFL